MKDILKAIAMMTILADSKNVPAHMHGQQLDKIKAIGEAVLKPRNDTRITHEQQWGTPESTDSTESTERGI